MKGLAWLLLLALSVPAWAQAPADAPLNPLKALPIAGGAPAPSDGVFMTTEAAAQLGHKCRQAQLENEEMAKQLQAQPATAPTSLTTLAITGGAGLVLGFLVGLVVLK